MAFKISLFPLRRLVRVRAKICFYEVVKGLLRKTRYRLEKSIGSMRECFRADYILRRNKKQKNPHFFCGVINYVYQPDRRKGWNQIYTKIEIFIGDRLPA